MFAGFNEEHGRCTNWKQQLLRDVLGKDRRGYGRDRYKHYTAGGARIKDCRIQPK